MNGWMEMRVFSWYKRMLVLWLLSPPVMAGGMGADCEAWDVKTPCLMDSWSLEAHALLLQANSTAIEFEQKVTTATGQAEYGVIPTWQWGFQVGGTYLWNSGHDFVWSWSNYRNNDIESALPHPVALGTVLRDKIFAFPKVQELRDVILDSATFKTTYEWDQINFEFGQSIIFSNRVSMRPQAGLQIVRVANYLNSGFGTTSEEGVSLISAQTSAMFNGSGPRSGLELRWESDWGLSVYGQGNLGLIYGPGKSNEYITNVLINAMTIYNLSWSKIVPTLDAKMGAECQFEMAQGLLSLDAGWQWNTYQSALRESSFSIQGLYFGLKWLGTLA